MFILAPHFPTSPFALHTPMCSPTHCLSALIPFNRPNPHLFLGRPVLCPHGHIPNISTNPRTLSSTRDLVHTITRMLVSLIPSLAAFLRWLFDQKEIHSSWQSQSSYHVSPISPPFLLASSLMSYRPYGLYLVPFNSLYEYLFELVI